MKILFDHCVPKPLRRELPGHDITTARDMRWEGLKNGRLLDEAQAAGFDVLLTVDHNIRYQQNLTGRAEDEITALAAALTTLLKERDDRAIEAQSGASRDEVDAIVQDLHTFLQQPNRQSSHG